MLAKTASVKTASVKTASVKTAPAKATPPKSIALKTPMAPIARGRSMIVLPPAPVPKPPPVDLSGQKQQQSYEEAIGHFHSQKFERAKALFQKALDGPNRALAHHAQIHLQICQKKLAPAEVTCKTAEDHYNYAVTLINTRRLSEASRHLEAAIGMSPEADHLHYALAAAEALQGNPQGAYERLKTAIHLQPRNRILARGDADFSSILDYPPLAALLQTDSGWSPKAS
jgi:tetratricopeptide (TPR) repeat protein